MTTRVGHLYVARQSRETRTYIDTPTQAYNTSAYRREIATQRVKRVHQGNGPAVLGQHLERLRQGRGQRKLANGMRMQAQSPDRHVKHILLAALRVMPVQVEIVEHVLLRL